MCQFSKIIVNQEENIFVCKMHEEIWCIPFVYTSNLLLYTYIQAMMNDFCMNFSLI